MPPALKLTAFERCMLADDHAEHPMTFTIRLRLNGRLDGDLLRHAARQVVERHPLLAAHVEGSGRNTRWVPAADPTPWVHTADLHDPCRYPGSEQIDLRRETGWRVWGRTHGTTSELRIQFHHCCTDGLGAYQVVEDLLVAYDALGQTDGRAPRFRPLDPRRLSARNRFGLSHLQVLARLLLEVWGIAVGNLMFFLQRATPLHAAQTPSESAAERLMLLDYPTHTFTPVETKQLQAVSRAAGATLTDLVLRDLFLAMDAWNQRLDRRGRFRLLRIMLPISLRTAEDVATPAANIVGMVPIDRRPALFGSPHFLLRTLLWETWLLKRFRFAIAYNRSCALFGLLPGGIERLTRPDRCYATSVLSNMGKIFDGCPLVRIDGRLQVGSLQVESWESAPPVRFGTSTGFTFVSYAGRLILTMNYARRHFTAAEAQDFFQHVVLQLQQTARTAPTVTTAEPVLPPVPAPIPAVAHAITP